MSKGESKLRKQDIIAIVIGCLVIAGVLILWRHKGKSDTIEESNKALLGIQSGIDVTSSDEEADELTEVVQAPTPTQIPKPTNVGELPDSIQTTPMEVIKRIEAPLNELLRIVFFSFAPQEESDSLLEQIQPYFAGSCYQEYKELLLGRKELDETPSFWPEEPGVYTWVYDDTGWAVGVIPVEQYAEQHNGAYPDAADIVTINKSQSPETVVVTYAEVETTGNVVASMLDTVSGNRKDVEIGFGESGKIIFLR